MIGTHLITCLFTLVLLLAILASPARAQDAGAINFEQRLETARVLAEAGDKPIVVYFTAEWCAWCRKMSTSTFTDRSVSAYADKFIWVKIDVDVDPVVPAIFGVQSVPTLIAITADGWALAGHGGYATPAVMETFLAEALTKADAPLDPAIAELLDKSRQAGDRSVRQVIEALARPDRVGRTALVSLLVDQGAQAYPVLLDAMADDKLAIRAAAGDVLAVATQAALPFDAFADEVVRSEQVTVWRAYVEALPAKAQDTSPQSDAAGDEADNATAADTPEQSQRPAPVAAD